MARNIHQSKRLKPRKVTPASQLAPQPAAASNPAVTAVPLKTAPVKATALQDAAAAKVAELPYELRRIAFFTAFVVVLVVVLWFFLK